MKITVPFIKLLLTRVFSVIGSSFNKNE